MVPNVPQDLCLVKVKSYVDKFWDVNISIESGLTKKLLLECIEFLVSKPLIKIGDKTYQQVKGVLIGNPAALPISEIFLWESEEEGVAKVP